MLHGCWRLLSLLLQIVGNCLHNLPCLFVAVVSLNSSNVILLLHARLAWDSWNWGRRPAGSDQSISSLNHCFILGIANVKPLEDVDEVVKGLNLHIGVVVVLVGILVSLERGKAAAQHLLCG